MSHIIGVDFGTSRLRAAVVRYGAPKSIFTRPGFLATRAIVAYGAKRRQVDFSWGAGAACSIWGIKRLLGRRFDAPAIQRWKPHLPYTIVPAPNGAAWVEVRGTSYAPERIAAAILQQARLAAEAYLREPVVDSAVVSVPVSFSLAQRQAIIDSGRIAGLKVIRMIDDATAAAVAHYFDRKGPTRTVAVYALGAGFFSTAVIDMGDGVFEAKAVGGEPFLGGDDLDTLLVGHLADAFKRRHQMDVAADKEAMQKVRTAAEQAKVALSSAEEVEVTLQPFATSAGAAGSTDREITLTRATVDGLAAGLISKCEDRIRSTLADVGRTAAEIDEVLLVGAMTRMPRVRASVERLFGAGRIVDLDAENACARGAAIAGSHLEGEIKGVLRLEVIPHALGVRPTGGAFVPVMPRNSMYPTKATMKFHLNPDRPASFDGCLIEELPADAGGLEILSEISVDCAPGRFWFRTAPAGIDVTFDLDAGRGLSVQAQTKTRRNRNARTTSLSRAPTEAQLAAWTAEEVGLRKAAKDDFDEVGLARPLVGGYFPARPLRGGLRTCVVCEMTWKSTRGEIQDAIYEGAYPKNYKVRGGTFSEEDLLGLTCTHCKRAFCKVHLEQSIPSRLPGGKCPACGELLHSA